MVAEAAATATIAEAPQRLTAVDTAQQNGEAVTNLTDAKRYRRVRMRFLIQQAQNGDEFAMEKLCENAVQSVIHTVGGFFKIIEKSEIFGDICPDEDEFIQAGLMKVPSVIERFDTDRDLHLAPYLGQRLNGTMLDQLLSLASKQGISRQNYYSICKALRGNDDPDKAMQELVGSGLLEAATHVKDGQFNLASISLEQIIEKHGEDTPAYLISPANVEEDVLGESLIDTLEEYLNRLPERQRYVLVSNLGLFGEPNRTLAEIGAELGVTEGRISQIRTKGLTNLRQMLSNSSFIPDIRRSGKFAKLKTSPNPIETAHRAIKKLSQYSNSKLVNSEIEDIASLFPNWKIDNAYRGANKVTTIARQVALHNDLPEFVENFISADNRSARLVNDNLSLEIVDATGNDLQTAIELEVLLAEKAEVNAEKIEVNYESLGLLSESELQILQRLHMTDKEIAAQLGPLSKSGKMSTSTVRSHRHNIYEKLGLDNSSPSALAIYAVRNGIYDLNDVPIEFTTYGLSPMGLVLTKNYTDVTYEKAAEALNLSVSTIRTHWHNVYSKTGVYNRVQLTLAAMRDGLIPIHPSYAENGIS
jgi:RNA polymerase sigma factor (sigma-70 family)